MRKLLIPIALVALVVAVAIAAETTVTGQAAAPASVQAVEAESCAVEFSEERYAQAIAALELELGLVQPQAVSGGGLTPCPLPGGSCDRCVLGQGTCVPGIFFPDGRCSQQDTGITACELPNGTGVSCIGGKTIHQVTCNCVSGGPQPCTGACLGGVRLASYSCQ